jgi:hypothetical protein
MKRRARPAHAQKARTIVITGVRKIVIPVDDESRAKEFWAPRVALVTCSQMPALDDDTRRLIGPLMTLGINPMPVIWNDQGVNWAGVDLAIVRSCWDYIDRRIRFLKWSLTVPRLANPADVLRWNTDKAYLRDLGAAGVPTVPTLWLEPCEDWVVPQAGDWVIKPTVSIASLDTGRYRLSDPGERRLARAHVDRLVAAGQTVMIQRYLHRIDIEGETSLVYLGGKFSHAMKKAAVLTGPDVGIDRRFLPQGGLNLRSHQATSMELAIAERALAAVPGGADRLLYARVDLVPGDDGRPVLLELELTEPQVYLGQSPGAASRFAAVIAAAVCRSAALEDEPSSMVGVGHE